MKNKNSFVKMSLDDPRLEEARAAGEKWRRSEDLKDAGNELGLLLTTEIFSIYRDPIVFPSGQLGTYLRIEDAEETGRSVGVLTVLPNNRFVLLEQQRYPAAATILETPRGFGRKSENSELSARREVEEETGGNITKLERLGSIYTNSGISDEIVDLFFCEIQQLGVSNEEGVRKILTYSEFEIKELISSGNISDPFFLSAYAMAISRRLIPLPCSHDAPS
ncbi:MAG: NUDIX hydrolase [Cyanobacteria bacterium P01_F01_bin.33]